MTSIAILGIGNNLLKDDGAGIHALTCIRDGEQLPDVTCVDAGTVGLALIDHLSNLDGIVALFNAFLIDCQRYQRKTHLAPYAPSGEHQK